jgi:hypothetical protein
MSEGVSDLAIEEDNEEGMYIIRIHNSLSYITVRINCINILGLN